MKVESFESFRSTLTKDSMGKLHGGYIALEKSYCYTDCESTSGSSTADCGDGDWD